MALAMTSSTSGPPGCGWSITITTYSAGLGTLEIAVQDLFQRLRQPVGSGDKAIITLFSNTPRLKEQLILEVSGEGEDLAIARVHFT